MSIGLTESVTRSLTERAAEEIRALMARRQKRQSQLARHLGVSEQWVSVRLRGVQPIDLNDLQQIAEFLDVEAADLIPRRTADGLTPTTGTQADPRTGTNARSPRPTERPTLTGQPKRAQPRESTRRPARTVPFIAELMPDDLIADLADAQAA